MMMSRNANQKGTHFLLQAKARTLSLRDIYKNGEDAAFDLFKQMRWPETKGEPVCPKSAASIPTKSRLAASSSVATPVAITSSARPLERSCTAAR